VATDIAQVGRAKGGAVEEALEVVLDLPDGKAITGDELQKRLRTSEFTISRLRTRMNKAGIKGYAQVVLKDCETLVWIFGSEKTIKNITER
jgi:hypothetical protein